MNVKTGYKHTSPQLTTVIKVLFNYQRVAGCKNFNLSTSCL